MKFEHLKAFVAVVEAGSYAKAANEILLVTQPAVSRAIQNLEAELGFQVFDRSQYRPSLTPQGQAFYPRAVHLLSEVEALQAFSQTLASGVEPELQIAVDGYILLPRMLKAFHATQTAFPETQLHIRCGQLGSALRHLLAHEVDLAVVPWRSAYAGNPQLQSQKLACIQASTVVAADFPLLQKPGPVALSELAPYIQVVERTDAAYQAEEMGVLPHCQHWYVNDAHTKKQILLAGRSFGLLPYHLIERELQDGLLVPFENLEGFQVFEMELRVACLKSCSRGPVLEAVWKRLSR